MTTKADGVEIQEQAITVAPVRESTKPIEHTVKPGETLEKIAAQYGILHADWLAAHPANAHLFDHPLFAEQRARNVYGYGGKFPDGTSSGAPSESTGADADGTTGTTTGTTTTTTTTAAAGPITTTTTTTESATSTTPASTASAPTGPDSSSETSAEAVHPGLLEVGVKVVIPPRAQTLTCVTGKRHVFRLRPVKPLPPIPDEVALRMAQELALRAYLDVKRDAEKPVDKWKAYVAAEGWKYTKSRSDAPRPLHVNAEEVEGALETLGVAAVEEETDWVAYIEQGVDGLEEFEKASKTRKVYTVFATIGKAVKKGLDVYTWYKERQARKQELWAYYRRELISRSNKLVKPDAPLTWYEEKTAFLVNQGWTGDLQALKQEKIHLDFAEALSTDVKEVLRKCVVHLRKAEHLLAEPEDEVAGDPTAADVQLPTFVKPNSPVGKALTHTGKYTSCTDLVKSTKYLMKFLHEADKFKNYLLPGCCFLVFFIDELCVFLRDWERIRPTYEAPILEFMRAGNHELCLIAGDELFKNESGDPKICMRAAEDRRKRLERWERYGAADEDEPATGEGADGAAPEPSAQGQTEGTPRSGDEQAKVHEVHLQSYRMRLANAIVDLQRSILFDKDWSAIHLATQEEKDRDPLKHYTAAEARFQVFRHDLLEHYDNPGYWRSFKHWFQNESMKVSRTEAFDKVCELGLPLAKRLKRKAFQELEDLVAPPGEDEAGDGAGADASDEAEGEADAASGDESSAAPASDRSASDGSSGESSGSAEAASEASEAPAAPEKDQEPEWKVELREALAIWQEHEEDVEAAANEFVKFVREKIAATEAEYTERHELLPDVGERFAKARDAAAGGKELKSAAIKLEEVFAKVHEQFKDAHEALRTLHEALRDPATPLKMPATCGGSYDYAQMLFTFHHSMDAMGETLLPLMNFVADLVARAYELTEVERIITGAGDTRERWGVFRKKVFPFIRDTTLHKKCHEAGKLCYGPAHNRTVEGLRTARYPMRGETHEEAEVQFLEVPTHGYVALAGKVKKVKVRMWPRLNPWHKAEFIIHCPLLPGGKTDPIHISNVDEVPLVFDKAGEAELTIEPIFACSQGGSRSRAKVKVNSPKVSIERIEPEPRSGRMVEANKLMTVHLKVEPPVEEPITVNLTSVPSGAISPTVVTSKPFKQSTSVQVRVATASGQSFSLKLEGERFEPHEQAGNKDLFCSGIHELKKVKITAVEPQKDKYEVGDRIVVKYALHDALPFTSSERARVRIKATPVDAIETSRLSDPFRSDGSVKLALSKAGDVTLEVEPLDGTCELDADPHRTIKVENTVPEVDVTFDPLPKDGAYLPGQEVTVKLKNVPEFDRKNTRRSKVRVTGDVRQVMESDLFRKDTEVKVKIADRKKDAGRPDAEIVVEAVQDCKIKAGQERKTFKLLQPTALLTLVTTQPTGGFVSQTEVTVKVKLDPPLPGGLKANVVIEGEPAEVLAQPAPAEPFYKDREVKVRIGTEPGNIKVRALSEFVLTDDRSAVRLAKPQLSRLEVDKKTPNVVKQNETFKVYVNLKPRYAGPAKAHAVLRTFDHETVPVTLWEDTSVSVRVPEGYPEGEHELELSAESPGCDPTVVKYKIQVKGTKY